MTRLLFSVSHRAHTMVALSVATAIAGCAAPEVPTAISDGVPAHYELVSGNAQIGPVGAELPDALVIRVTDDRGRAVKGDVVNFRVVSGGGSVFAGSGASNKDGLVKDRWTLGTVAGEPQRVEARAVDPVTGAAIVFGVFTGTATPGPAFAISKASGDTSVGVVGVTLPNPLVARIEDQYGNAVPGVTVSWTTSTPGASISASTAVSDANGLASIFLTPALGDNVVFASVPGLAGSPLTFTSIGTPPPPVAITVFGGQGQNATAGTLVAVPPAVKVVDANGNGVPGTAVTFMVFSGGGSITGANAVSDANGIATVGSWRLGTIAGTNSLRATASGLAGSPITFMATGTVGAATILVRAANDVGATAPVGTAVHPSVKATDANGNGVAGVNVTFAVTGGAGSVTGANVPTDANGVATVGSWTLGAVPGPNSLSATAIGLTGSPVTFSVATFVPSGSVVALVKTGGDLAFGTVGQQLPIPLPSVRAVDAFGNGVPGVLVTFAVTGGGGSLIGGSVTSQFNGTAALTSWTLGTIAGTNTLTASYAGMTGPPVTFTATGIPAAPAKLAFITQPTDAVAGVLFSPPPRVAIQDVYGNTVTSVNNGVFMEIATNPGGILSGNIGINSVSGVATFDRLYIEQAGVGYTLKATSPGLTSAISVAFSITPP